MDKAVSASPVLQDPLFLLLQGLGQHERDLQSVEG